MAETVLSIATPTLLDLVKSRNPDGSQAHIVEYIQAKTPELEHMVWREGNLDTGHRVTSGTALPSVTWVSINEGVGMSKGVNTQSDEACGRMAAYTGVDAELVRLNGGSAYRLTGSAKQLMAFRKELGTGLFYHSTAATPQKINGLAPRYASTTGTSGTQIVIGDSGASSTDQTSVWLICWGDGGVYGIFPKGTTGGLEHRDCGLEDVDVTTTAELAAGTRKFQPMYRDYWQWRVGVCVEDYRQAVRVANIDTGNLVKTGQTGTNLIESMIDAYHCLGDPQMGRCVWYVNRKVATYLHHQARNEAGSTITVDTVGGKVITSFLGFPVVTTDSITNAESTIS